MKWKKLGQVFCPSGEFEWMHSHAANPVADHVGGNRFRIYFSTRDQQNRSSIAWVEIEMSAPTQVVRVCKEPVLSPGPIGCFDDSGCSIGSIVRVGDLHYLYYMGWNLGVTVPWRNSIGLAISADGGQTYRRHSLAPLMDRSAEDPYTLSYPWVVRNTDGWHMWYGSNLEWGATQADMSHFIKYASSDDGLSWSRNGHVVITPESESEYAFARPCVVQQGGKHLMWYAYRGESYRIGYAESHDGRTWTRRDELSGITVSEGHWDGLSIEYPSVFSHQGRQYLLYCGDGYGKTGFGIAVATDD
ncbi:hypothetical protein DM872_05875 [Pseudomonas taiwanensis]|uniref:hypothetical protein n=1 Tax=Pseudomonas taiwanensis TaxID=470150 RepID=UPI0015B7EFFC|nr:hypothetical protein [Pseudomonas taiwanensis]NWL76374.1 hypothetical protein [Pseudomonas taiwanensis]